MLQASVCDEQLMSIGGKIALSGNTDSSLKKQSRRTEKKTTARNIEHRSPQPHHRSLDGCSLKKLSITAGVKDQVWFWAPHTHPPDPPHTSPTPITCSVSRASCLSSLSPCLVLSLSLLRTCINPVGGRKSRGGWTMASLPVHRRRTNINCAHC